jgi:hypothetical protein
MICGAGDADALALAAAELVRVAVEVVGVEADLVEQLLDEGASLGAAGDAVHAEGLADDVGHGHARVERAVGVLEDDLHVAPHAAQGLALELEDGLAVEADLAGGGLEQPEDRAPGGGLAAAGLAHQAEGLAAVDGEGDVVHGAHVADDAREEAALDGEVLLEAVHLDEGAVV